MNILIGIFTFILILVSVILILLVLMQRAKSDGGMGAAMGGGAAEATFGADTDNVLTGWTKTATIVFFVLSLVLYLGHIYTDSHKAATESLPTLEATPAAEMPAAPAPAPETAVPVAEPAQ